MRVQPRKVPVAGTAIRVKEDVIAGVGEWIVIGDDDSVSVMSDDDFRETYRSNGDAAPDPRDRTVKPVGPKGGALRPKRVSTGSIIGPNGTRLGAQDTRVLYYLSKFAGPTDVPTLRTTMPVGQSDYDNVSASVSRLLHNGMVERDSMMRSRLTERGAAFLTDANVSAAFSVIGKVVP